MINQLNELTKNAESHDEELFCEDRCKIMILKLIYHFGPFSLSEYVKKRLGDLGWTCRMVLLI